MNFKIFFVTPYFGTFPNYIQLWLDSCGRNEGFTWLLITDCSVVNLNIPQNVIVKESTLGIFKNILGKQLGSSISLNSPYKLCDFRPVYWMILDFYKINYDFWGYCDMDLIFGRLSHFLPDELFDKYDRLYSEGHLSLMSASPFSKYAFMFDGSNLKWRKIFEIEKNIGFDEHHGVNKIWKKQKFLYYENTSEILDIDPMFNQFSLTHLPSNKSKQFFFVEEGKVMQGYFREENQLKVKEFAYIHFQKRKMIINDDLSMSDRFIISHKGISRIGELPISYKELKLLINYSESDFSEFLKKVRRFIRFYKNRLFNEF